MTQRRDDRAEDLQPVIPLLFCAEAPVTLKEDYLCLSSLQNVSYQELMQL